MKEKKGIAGLFLAGVLLANGTAVSAAEVKNLEVNRMPSGDMAEYTPSKPMELLSGQDAAELDAIMQAYNAGGSSLNKNASGSYYYYENLDPVAKEIYDVMLGVAQDPVSEGNIGLMMTDIDPTGQDYYYVTWPTGPSASIIRSFSGSMRGRRRRWSISRKRSTTAVSILSISRWQSLLRTMRHR